MSKNGMNKQALPKPIRVMHIIDKLGVSGSSIHGITMALAWWVPRFDPQSFQFSVCSLREPEEAGKALEQVGVKPYYLSRHKFDPRTVTDLLHLVKAEKPHILHLHGFGACNFGRIVSLLTGIPNIVHEHANFFHQPLYQTFADTVLSPLTTRAIALSQPVRDYMIEGRKINPNKIDTFFYGLPLNEFESPAIEAVIEARRSLCISSDENVVSSVGRLDTQKGQIYLLRAASLILKEVPDTRFLIIGDGPDRQMLEEVARQEGVVDRVIFTGYRRDIPVLLELTDVFAIPSLREGGPLTLFEAMSLRKPVVGTPTGLIPDVIRDGENGFLVPVRDVEMLADRITRLLKNPELAQKMGNSGWEACQQYDIEHSVDRLSRIYHELILFKGDPKTLKMIQRGNS